MKKMMKIFKHISIISLMSTTAISFVSLSSCKEKIKIEKIAIVAPKQAISPGESSQLLISYQPRTAPQPNISWEFTDLPEHLKSLVTIDKNGKISISSSTSVEGQYIEIHVKASVADQPEVNDTKGIYIIPPGTTGFIGFENEEVKYLDPAGNEASMKIINPDPNKPNKYETIDYINLFESEHEYPPGWKTPIQFTPIFTPGPEIDRNMEFYQKSYDVPEITWETYTEGNDTDIIPNFWCTNNTFPETYIKVKFAVDSDVELKIKFHVWQNRQQQKTLGRILYYPDPEKQDDNYEIQLMGEGEYICNLRCPIKVDPEDKRVYSDKLSYIICHGGVREFNDYEVKWDMSILDPRLNKAFKLEPHETESRIRQYDLLPYWITGFDYSFDLSEMQPTEQWEYQSMQLFRLSLHDKWNPHPEQMEAWCTFSVEWIDNEAQ